MMNKSQTHRFCLPFTHSIRFKLILAVVSGGIVLLIFSLWLLTDSMTAVEQNLMDSRLAADIAYLRDELGEADGTEWSSRDGALYIGDSLIGDGTAARANEEIFYHCQEITGTFYYTFVRTYNDDELTFVDAGGYQQGHYKRVAGTTKGPNGEDIKGTYIDKEVSDILERSLSETGQGVYSGRANVNGRMIYCRYELLMDGSGEIAGAIVVGRSVEEMDTMMRVEQRRGFIVVFTALLMICIGVSITISFMIAALGKIRDRLELIGTGNFPDEPLHLNTKDELNDISESINSMVESLKEKERIGAELDIAARIQTAMLPCIFPFFSSQKEFEICASMDPANEVGGDFYDFFMVDPDHLAFVVADVSGKGVPAALYMVIGKTLIKDHTGFHDDLGKVFTEVNEILCAPNSEEMFITAFEGVLNLRTGELRYVNAGHEIPFLCRKGSAYEPFKVKPGFVLAGMEGMTYTGGSIQLHPGDRIFQYTDGIPEAVNTKREQYGMEQLGKVLAEHSSCSPSQLLPIIKADVDAFAGAAPQFDDITMLCLRYDGPANESADEEKGCPT